MASKVKLSEAQKRWLADPRPYFNQYTDRTGPTTERQMSGGTEFPYVYFWHRMGRKLERAGYARDQVGAAMGGIGLALVQVHCSPRSALAMVETLRDVLLSDQAVKQ